MQGRTESAVRGYFGHLQLANDFFGSRASQGYLLTELASVGRSIPGNLVQGGPDIVQSLGPLFQSPEHSARFRPFVNDVAGHQWLSGYAGDISHQWLTLRDFDDLLYFLTPVVHGLVPIQAPFATGGRYFDFFQLCAEGLFDCGDPRFRGVELHSVYANDAMEFFRRHGDILTRWRREPLPGTHDIAAHEIEFHDGAGGTAYKVSTDALAFGCFGDGDRIAVALTNPQQTAGRVRFVIERGRYGFDLAGHQRVSLQRLGEVGAQMILEQTSGDLAFEVELPPLGYAMLTIDPAVAFTSTPNAAGCEGGALLGRSTYDGTEQTIEFAIDQAPPGAQGLLAIAAGPGASPLPTSLCSMLIDLASALTVPCATDASGATNLSFRSSVPLDVHVQGVLVDPLSGSLVATNAVHAQRR